MSNFEQLPMDTQITRITELAYEALKQWEMSPESIELIKYRENAVFKVLTLDGKQFALRLHRPDYHDDAELRSELQWISALENSGVDVPSVIPAANGQLLINAEISSVPQARQADLFAWVNGDQLGSLEDGLEGDKTIVRENFLKIGEIAANLHDQACNWEMPDNFKRHSWDIDGLVGDAPFWGPFWELESLTNEQKTLLIQAKEQAKKDLAAFGKTAQNFSMIHADFVPENLLVDGDIVRLIDFDDAGFGWHMFEIATALYFIQDDPNYSIARDSLIDGYRKNRALPDADVARLNLFLALRGFTYLGWVQSRSETETAQELTPYLVEMACRTAEQYLA